MHEVTLHVIGCGDAFGSGGRFNTCFYVKTTSLQFLIDCGASSLVALKKNNISTDDIDIIAISHFHGDHFGGLVFFILDAAIFAKRTKPLTIISPPGCKSKLDEAIELSYPGLSNILDDLKIEFLEFQPYQTIKISSFALQAFPVIHTKETLPHAFRITIENKIISFSGDTEWTDELLEVARNADLFICECNFFETEVKGHLNYKTIMRNMSGLDYKKILLTHFGKDMLENLEYVNLDCAEDGMFITI